MAWEQPLETLRAKWGTIPLHDRRAESAALLERPDDEFLALWRSQRDLEGAAGTFAAGTGCSTATPFPASASSTSAAGSPTTH
jgi:hypothetical protein